MRVDCDVLQADGGTRTASITGAYLALHQAFTRMMDLGVMTEMPFSEPVAAVSCGIYNGSPVLDLDYAEDSNAQADANFVLTGSGRIVEIQGTAEEDPFTVEEFQGLLDLAQAGCADLVRMQQAALDAVTASA